MLERKGEEPKESGGGSGSGSSGGKLSVKLARAQLHGGGGTARGSLLYVGTGAVTPRLECHEGYCYPVEVRTNAAACGGGSVSQSTGRENGGSFPRRRGRR